MLTGLSSVAFGWHARFTPAEADVAWSEAAAFVMNHGDPGRYTLHGLVEVEGDARGMSPLLAELDANGMVNWSKRLPPGTPDGSIQLWHTAADAVFAAYGIEEDGVARDIVGCFNPLTGFSMKYGFSLPSFDGEVEDMDARTYAHLANDDLAVIEQDDNRIHVTVLNEAGERRFARTYTFPETDSNGYPWMPAWSTYTAGIAANAAGGYYLLVSDNSLFEDTSTAYIVSLTGTGAIIWQAGLEFSGYGSISIPLPDGRLALAGDTGDFDDAASALVVLTPGGKVELAVEIAGLSGGFFAAGHYETTGDWLITGDVPEDGMDSWESDAAAVLLTSGGALKKAVAFDLGESTFIGDIGSTGTHLFFMLNTLSGGGSDRASLLARSDRSLENWQAVAYEDKAGPHAMPTPVFGDGFSWFLAFADNRQDWVYFNQITYDLQDPGPCGLLSPAPIAPYTPALEARAFSPAVNRDFVQSGDWADAPPVTPHVFSLVDTPLTREVACMDGPVWDPLSPWRDIEPVNEDGWKLTDFGWVVDEHYPQIWLDIRFGWVYVADEQSDHEIILGYDYDGDTWFYYNPDWKGYHYEFIERGECGWTKPAR